MLESVRKNTPDCYHAWQKYCAVKNWREAGRHVDWAYEEDGNTLWLYFQGSDERIDWVRDCMAFPTIMTPFFDRWVHYGFARSLGDLFKDPIFLDYWAITPHTNVVGYSSGGAFALIAMTEVCDLIRAPVKIIAFATPRVAWIKQLGIAPNIEIVNVQTYGDPVVHLPPKIFGYVDNPGLRLFIGGQQPKLSIKQHWPETYSKALSKL